MLVDANVLLYAVDSSSPHHDRAAAWLRTALEGNTRVGIPWQSIVAFLRIATHPRLVDRPLTGEQAWTAVESWFASPVCWLPEVSRRTVGVLGRLVAGADIRGNLVFDAQLAALAIEHGVALVSTDTDFARFRELRWINPLHETLSG